MRSLQGPICIQGTTSRTTSPTIVAAPPDRRMTCLVIQDMLDLRGPRPAGISARLYALAQVMQEAQEVLWQRRAPQGPRHHNKRKRPTIAHGPGPTGQHGGRQASRVQRPVEPPASMANARSTLVRSQGTGGATYCCGASGRASCSIHRGALAARAASNPPTHKHARLYVASNIDTCPYKDESLEWSSVLMP